MKLPEISTLYPPVARKFLRRLLSITDAIKAIAVIKNPNIVPELLAMALANVVMSLDENKKSVL